jgi:enterochelin esterase-like enzyme
LKTGDQVFQDLQAGRGFLIQGADALTGKTIVNIKKLYLAYLIPGYYTPYIQPVYVFIGEDNFVAYIPAVIDAWVQGAQVITPTLSVATPTADVPTPTPISIPVR